MRLWPLYVKLYRKTETLFYWLNSKQLHGGASFVKNKSLFKIEILKLEVLHGDNASC